MMRYILTTLFLTTTFFTTAQIVKKDTIIEDLIFIEGDSIMFTLEDVMVLSKLKFNSTKEQRYYYWYWKKVHNAYPFAKLAAERLLQLNEQLKEIKSQSKRNKHIRKMQKFMEEEFTEKLKKMTRTEGKIIIKLIHRQTGLTTFELIKEYRSGWKAFWYNTTASLFKLSLKSEYHPESEAIDFLVEDILQRSFVQGQLERQEARLAIDYLELVPKYKNIDIIEVVNNRNK